MKGIQGLIVAIGLGLTGALFNWAYLSNKSKEVEKVEFIGIKPEVTIERGQRLVEGHLEPVPIPKAAVGNLGDFAILYSQRETVLNRNVCRTLPGRSLLLQDDLKTPPPELNFGHTTDRDTEERAMGIPTENRGFVAELYNPGDLVDFVVPKNRIGGPTPAVLSVTPTAAKPAADPSKPGALAPKPAEESVEPSTVEIIGPFKILSLGNRLGTTDVMRAAGKPPAHENVMTISVKVVKGELEPKAQKLWNILLATNFQQVGILLHARPAK